MQKTIKPVSENILILIIASVQFINVLDFMMVMPLGPDFARALDIPISHIGWVGGMYTFSAAISGFLCACFLDNYDRKKVLLTALAGLIVSTGLCAASWNFHSMMFFRALAGVFGGPLFSITIAIVSDNVEEKRRGISIAKVMAAFSVASVLGVPFGLEAARHFNWYSPFLILSAIGSIVLYFAATKLPAQNKFIVKLPIKMRLQMLLANFSKPLYVGTFAFMGFGIMAGSMMIPNIPAHLQFTLNYPRELMWLLYFFGGVFSLLAIGIGGRVIDKFNSSTVALVSTTIASLALIFGYIKYDWWVEALSGNTKIPVIAIFIAFMLGLATRNLAGQTLASKIPLPQERAGFSSVQHSIINICQSIGAFSASVILTSDGGMKLTGIEKVATCSIIISIISYIFLSRVERAYKAKKLKNETNPKVV